MSLALRLALAGSIAASALAASAAANAGTVVALQDGKTLASIDTDKKAVTGTVTLARGATLVGIDVRPSDGKLYGLTRDGAIVVIDAKTGKWEKKSQLSEKLSDASSFAVDFNPAADRLRVIGSDGSSLRINVEDGKAAVDGKLRFADADAAKGKQPNVIAAAYTNSFAGTKETALYDIDAATGTLVKQAPPNDGILNTVGALGIESLGHVAFDIASDGKGGNTGWIVNGATLMSVNLANGTSKAVGKIAGIKGRTWDIAVMP